jgi:hypothetical protein
MRIYQTDIRKILLHCYTHRKAISGGGNTEGIINVKSCALKYLDSWGKKVNNYYVT